MGSRWGALILLGKGNRTCELPENNQGKLLGALRDLNSGDSHSDVPFRHVRKVDHLDVVGVVSVAIPEDGGAAEPLSFYGEVQIVHEVLRCRRVAWRVVPHQDYLRVEMTLRGRSLEKQREERPYMLGGIEA